MAIKDKLRSFILDENPVPRIDRINGHGSKYIVDATRESMRRDEEARRQQVVAALGSEATAYGIVPKEASQEIHSGKVPVVKIEVSEISTDDKIEVTTS